MKIACFGHTIDPAFLKKSYAKHLVVFLPKSAKHLQKKFKNSRVVFFDFPRSDVIEDFSDEENLKKASIAKTIKKASCTHFLVSHRSTKALFNRCRKLNLTPIGNDFKLAAQLENKKYFDSLLTKLKIAKPTTIKKTVKKLSSTDLPCVVQEISSFGSFGTSIPKTIDDLNKLHKKFHKKPSPLLIRKFIKGEVFGITLVIHQKGVILSGIRQQCYFQTNKDCPITFAGIQWIPTPSFKIKTKKAIEQGCQRIGGFLRKKKFFGTIHFDFMIDVKGDVFFIECNPRPSSATPQLLKHPELIHGIDFSKILLTELQNLPHKPRISNSKYRGSLLDLMILNKLAPLKRTSQKRDSSRTEYFFSLPTFSSSRQLSFLGTIISDDTLFTKNGSLNDRAKSIYKMHTGITL